MKEKILTLSAFFILSFVSCSKQNDVEEDFNPRNLEINKLADVIPPSNSLTFNIIGFKSEDIVADSMQFGYIYKSFGTAYAGPTDSIVAVDLEPSQTSYSMLKYEFIRGNQYTLTIPVAFEGYDEAGWPNLSGKSYFPSIEVYTLKNFNGTSSIMNSTHQEKSNDDSVIKWSIDGPADVDLDVYTRRMF